MVNIKYANSLENLDGRGGGRSFAKRRGWHRRIMHLGKVSTLPPTPIPECPKFLTRLRTT